MAAFVIYFLGAIGLLLVVMGAYLVFASNANIVKMLKWFYSFSTIKPKKSIEGRPLKTLRFNGIIIIIAGVFMVVLSFYLQSEIKQMLSF